MTLRHARRIAGEIASRNLRTAAGSCPSAARARESREARSAAGAVSTPPFARTIEQEWGAARAGVNEVAGAAPHCAHFFVARRRDRPEMARRHPNLVQVL